VFINDWISVAICDTYLLIKELSSGIIAYFGMIFLVISDPKGTDNIEKGHLYRKDKVTFFSGSKRSF